MRISIDYKTEESQSVYLSGNIPGLGNWNELVAVPMVKISDSSWELQLEAEATEIQYRYLIKDNENNIIRKEWGSPHKISLETGKTYCIKDVWQDFPQQHHLYTSAFTDAFFSHNKQTQIKFYPLTYLFIVDCPYAEKGQVLKIYGAGPILGEWDVNRALAMDYTGGTTWQVSLDKTQLYEGLEYRFIICDESTGKIIHSDEAGNRFLELSQTSDTVQITHQEYRHSDIGWYGAGVSIPVFSLKSKDSYGIGEFPDLKKLIKWASITGQQVIQLLPINDTSTSFTWRDSYPYSTISIYALHPIYLGLSGFSLKDKALQDKIRKEVDTLNAQEGLDYANVALLKHTYIKALYEETGEKTLAGNEFHQFYIRNKEWLFPYACFCYFRNLHQTTDFSNWGEYETYDASRMELLFVRDKSAEDSIRMTYFIQFLLHQQLSEVKEYAHQHHVVLKGDIPIGVNRHSVETWIEPHLFHLDMQTGAPPDAFAVYGQNWGFPTYNWEEMAKDDYQWWRKRFAKMSDYFDAYRIDHILGFFRIWEIPRISIQGLLGHFNPAYPLTTDEIIQYGIGFNPVQMTQPYIHGSFLPDLFGDYLQEVIAGYLTETGDGSFMLNEICNTQEKIEKIFRNKDDDKSNLLREGLFRLCNEVLFIEDPEVKGKYHPRIIAQTTHMFEKMTGTEEESFNRLYEDFYFHRHTDYWKQEALKKLPELLSATSMLPCGEDLGMIPASVPEVMRKLQILSLEIERWPKEYRMFADLSKLPYLSVCTTSTHDMSPIRAWWLEEPEKTQQYYTDVLKREGKAPEDCIPDICRQIVFNHLASSSMLVILPLQDWMSIDGKLRKPDGNSERINIPADPAHNWQYRMHLTLEELIDAKEFNDMVVKLVRSGRAHLSENS